MFQPPCCPNRRCSQHKHPEPGFFARKGSYSVLCRPIPVPRFRCKHCRRGFSRQTFRADYHDHRPYLNAKLFLSLATGMGLRQSARNLGLSRRCTELKFHKIARHLRRLNLNLRSSLPEGSSLQFDELETYEGRRNTRPVSLAHVIDRGTRFIIWGESAPIRPHGRMSKKRKRAVEQDERRFGPRKDLSRRAVERTFRRAATLVEGLSVVTLATDEKPSYEGIARKVFGNERLTHVRVNSKLARGTWNPLFPINHTEAMARDLMGRLRRDSWLVSKLRRYLDLGVQMWMAYRNYVRRRFNHDVQSPAEMLGYVPRRLTPDELMTWRQDWGRESIHPLARNGSTTVARWQSRHAAA